MLHHTQRHHLENAAFHGMLKAGRQSWHVYFVAVTRLDRDWIIECTAVGPTIVDVSIRCPADTTHANAARRVMRAMADWLASDECRDGAFLELSPEPEAFERAS